MSRDEAFKILRDMIDGARYHDLALALECVLALFTSDPSSTNAASSNTLQDMIDNLGKN